MGIQINVTVNSGGLLERSRLQAAANRQAFVEGQQRNKAEQTGKEQRLERLAAEGRDAQSNLILPGRARQSALDRFIPQPAARRSGLNLPGLTIFYDRALRQPTNELIVWSNFLYKGGIKASNLLPQSEEVYATGQVYGSASLLTLGYPYKYIEMTPIEGASAVETIFHRGKILTEDEWTCITDIRLPSPSGQALWAFYCGDTRVGVFYEPGDDQFLFIATGPSFQFRFIASQGFGWLRFSVTYAAANLLLHINGKWVASIPYSISYATRAFAQERYVQSNVGASLNYALGLTRFVPRPLYAEEDYIVTPILKIR